MVVLFLPVRAMARRASDGSGLDQTDTRPVELVGIGREVLEGGSQGVWIEEVVGGFEEGSLQGR